MTNTKFRKRALLSSVAMLLVALVALGSATFAWFSTTNSATASPMAAKTAAASNILLTDDPATVEWTNRLTFTKGTIANSTNYAKNLKPVTTSDFENWYSVEAANLNDGYSATAYSSSNAVSNIQTTGEYAKYSPLFIKSAGETKTIKITPTVTGNEQSQSYFRIALVPNPSATGSSAFASGEAGHDAIVFAKAANDRSKPDSTLDPAVSGWTASGQTTQTSSIVTSQNWAAVTLGSATADAIYAFDVYVYYEGTDFDCVDSKSGTDMSVLFTVEAVE